MFLPMFPKLQELDLSYARIGDSCLHILGAFCTELRYRTISKSNFVYYFGIVNFEFYLHRYLNATDCGGVTDDGIRGLCCSDEYVDNETKRMGQCKLLHTLFMLGTNVTKKGVKVAIENLPELRKFDCSCSVQVLAELRRENFERGDFKTYPFTEFDCMGFEDDSGNIVPYESGSLRLAANICPSVNVVDIILETGVTDIELQGLLELKSLGDLSVSGHYPQENCPITFDGGILP